MTPSDKQEDSGSKPTQDGKDSSAGTRTVTESSGTHDAGTQKLSTVNAADTTETNDGESGSGTSKAQPEPAAEATAQSASTESTTAASESSSGPPPAPDWDAWGASSGGSQSEWGEPDWDASSGGAETPPWQRVAAAPSPADSGATQAIPVPNLDGGTDKSGAPGQGGVPNHDQSTVRTSTVSPGGPDSGGEQTERTSVSFAGDSSSTARTSFGSGSAAGSAGSAAASTASAARRPSRGPRRASLQVKRADPWSVLKLALVLSVALFFVWMIAVAVLYGVLDGMGVWDQLNGTFTELTQPEDAASDPLISAGRVFGVAAIIGGINIVLITALATVGAFIYNVAADFAGGVELTLSERE